MPTSISWDLFESTYLRPQIADIYGTQYDEDTLKKTTYAAISDLVSKGLVDIGPLPTTNTVNAIAQVNYLNPSQVTVGNKFSVTYKNTTVSFVATQATIANITSNLTSLINSNSTFSTDITAYDDSTRIRTVATTAGQSLDFYTIAERNTGTGNPVLELIVNTKAEAAKLLVNDLTTITANHADAFNTVAAGVKYFLVSDPITKLQTAAGLDIQKDDGLTTACKNNYETLILAYLRVRVLQEITAEAFWKERLQVTSTQQASGSSGQLTLAERLQLIEAEKNAKLAEIAREEDKELSLGDQKRLSSVELEELRRRYKLDDKEALVEKTATNGAWTSAGQFTISYLVDYEVALEDTVPLFLLPLDNDSFAIPTLIDVSTYTSAFINVSKYKRFDIEISASANVGFVLRELVGTDYQDVGVEVVDNAIVKSYSLVNTNIIKIAIRGIEANTQVYISGALKGY